MSFHDTFKSLQDQERIHNGEKDPTMDKMQPTVNFTGNYLRDLGMTLTIQMKS